MERFSQSSRFILICNFSSKIIEPIQSRCTILLFKHPNFRELLNFLIKVLEKKGQHYNLFILESIIFSSDGDFRGILKESEFSKIAKTNNQKYDEKNFMFIVETTSFPGFFISCKNQNFYLGFSILQQIWNQGVSELDIINGLFNTTKTIFLEESIKLKILNVFGEIRLKLVLNYPFEKILLYLIRKLIFLI
jgi:replication factor C subunit 2/4